MFDASFLLAELFALEGAVALGGFQFQAGNGGGVETGSQLEF